MIKDPFLYYTIEHARLSSNVKRDVAKMRESQGASLGSSSSRDWLETKGPVFETGATTCRLIPQAIAQNPLSSPEESTQ